jgi:predicted Zn-dependent protease
MMRKLFITALVLQFTFVIACNSEKAKQQLLAKANQLAANGATAEATLNYRKILQKDPRFGEAHYRLGLLELKENKILEAYQSLRSAVTLSPENMDAKAKLADMCLKMYVTDPRHPKNLYDQVVQLSDALIQKDAKSYDALRLKGYLAVLDRAPKQAAEFFKRAQASRPLDHETTIALAQSLNEGGSPQESEQLLRTAIAADKSYGPVYDILYLELVGQKRIDAAEQVLKDKISANPKEPVYAIELATHYLNAGKPADSNAVIDGLLSRENEFTNARRMVGEFYVRRGRLDDALDQFRAGMKAHPQDATT